MGLRERSEQLGKAALEVVVEVVLVAQEHHAMTKEGAADLRHGLAWSLAADPNPTDLGSDVASDLLYVDVFVISHGFTSV
jgi:hypothetical protein